MLRVFRIISCMGILATMMVTGCVSTTIQTDWRDPGFNGTFKKVLVICIVKDPNVRTTLESDLAAQFTKRGIDAVESNALFPSVRDIDREMVIRKVRAIDADGVLLIRPIGHSETVYESYSLSSAVFNVSDQSLSAETFRVKVSLFESAQGKVVWQAISDTMVGGAWMDTVRKFAEVMGVKLIERKLI